jgi:hypothetical protein
MVDYMPRPGRRQAALRRSGRYGYTAAERRLAMSENGDDLVARIHREAVERYREDEARGKARVEATHRAAWEELRAKAARVRVAVEAAHREAVERVRGQPLPPTEPATLHYTGLPEATADHPLFREWNVYRREVGRLLADGQEGKFVLIQGEAIFGLFDTWDAARQNGLRRFFGTSFLVHRVQTHEPLVRMRGYSLPCRS